MQPRAPGAPHQQLSLDDLDGVSGGALAPPNWSAGQYGPPVQMLHGYSRGGGLSDWQGSEYGWQRASPMGESAEGIVVNEEADIQPPTQYPDVDDATWGPVPPAENKPSDLDWSQGEYSAQNELGGSSFQSASFDGGGFSDGFEGGVDGFASEWA